MKKVIMLAVASLFAFSAVAQPKFAHVNFAELVQLMPEADEARTALEASNKEIQETYTAMVEEYNSKYAVYQQKAETWTPAVRQSKEKELQGIVSRISEFESSIERELAQQQQTLMAPIQKKAIDTVNKLAKEGGYIYVIDVNGALYIDDTQSIDLTPAARKILGIPEGRTLESLQQELAAKAAAGAAIN